MKQKGKLIVIDGGDASGKSTQAKLLIQYFRRRKIPVKYVDFPRYTTFHGKTLGRFLHGDFGQIDQISPYIVSYLYAADRFNAAPLIRKYLDEGNIVIANRYATSSMGHQAAKLPDKRSQDEYLRWHYELEYKQFGIPKEDLVIYLHVPWNVGLQLLAKKGQRKYLKAKTKDIAEEHHEHQIRTEKMFLYLCKKNRHWKEVECVQDDSILPIKKIHQKVLEVLKRRKFI